MPDREELFQEDVRESGRYRYQECLSRNKTHLMLLGAFAIVVICLIYIGHAQTKIDKDLIDALNSNDPKTDSLIGDEMKVSDNVKTHYFNVGMQQNYLGECQDKHFKLSFPDIDYAFMGYNILRGFPLETGHDPGFTYPLFSANYENGEQTADCRYSVPQGLVVVPDVSCITSFTSKIVQTQYEFANSLSASASVSGGGWGVSVSASAGYKESSSQISTGESVFIISSASCNYYFSKLVKRSPPPLDPVFLSWVRRLNNTNSTDTYIEFLDTYGTHFPTEITFGARFTYEHKMSSKKYETERESGVNVAVSASYSGTVNVGGGFSMDSSQKGKASEFSKNVETKTFSVGAAPPANGDAMTWASTVKDNPVPSSYKLSSIEELFTEKYMNAVKLNVNLAHIAKTLNETKRAYCSSMMSKNEVESCQSLSPGLMLDHTLLVTHFNSIKLPYKACIDHCLKLTQCVAIDYCVTCDKSNDFHSICHLFVEDQEASGRNRADWRSMIFIGKLKKELVLKETEIIGNDRGLDIHDKRNISSTRCKELCVDDPHCIAYSYCNCEELAQKCKVYSSENVKGFREESRTKTVFIAREI